MIRDSRFGPLIPGRCDNCLHPTTHSKYRWCGPCNDARLTERAEELARRAEAEAEAERFTSRARRCPICLNAPSRDQRPGSKRGRCIPCQQAADRRNDAA